MLAIYIEANSLLIVALFLWWSLKYLSDKTGLQTTQNWQQTIARSLIVLALLSPWMVRFIPADLTLDSSNSGRSMTVNVLSDLAGTHENASNNNPNHGGQDFVRFDPYTIREIQPVDRSVFEEPEPFDSPYDKGLIILYVFLFLGFSVQLGRYLRQIRRLQRLINQSYRWKSFPAVTLLISEQAAAPFATAILNKNYIVLPSHLLLSKNDLSMAVAHEAQHLRNGDLFWELLMEIFKLIFFCNPAIYLWKKELDKLREFACDESLLNQQRVSAHSYGHCLLNVAESVTNLRHGFPATVGMCSPLGMVAKQDSHLKQRIQLLTCFDNTPNATAKAALLVIPLLLMTLLFSALTYARYSWSITSDKPSPRLGDMYVYAQNLASPVNCSSWVTTSLNRDGYLVKRCSYYEANFSVEHDYNLVSIELNDNAFSHGEYQGEAQLIRQYEPYLPLLSFPLNVGKQWQQEYKGYYANGGGHWTSTMKCHVLTYETIATQMGDLGAYKVYCKDYLIGGVFSGSRETVYWYAPEVKSIIRLAKQNNRSASFEVVRYLLK